MEPTGNTVMALRRVPVEPSGDTVVILWHLAATRKYRTRVLVGGVRATMEPPGDTAVETGYLWSY